MPWTIWGRVLWQLDLQGQAACLEMERSQCAGSASNPVLSRGQGGLLKAQEMLETRKKNFGG